MKKILSCLFVLTLCAGCSCTPGGSAATPKPSASPSASPSPSSSPEAMTEATAKDYLDYLAERYTLMEPTMIEDLDANVMEGYSFGLNNESYYLIRLDPTNAQAAKWMSEIGNTGQIEVDVDGLPKTMTARINGNFALISANGNYVDGFQEYYDAFSGQQALPSTNTPTPSADANS